MVGGIVVLPGESTYRVLGNVQLILVGVRAGDVLAGCNLGGVVEFGRAQRANKTRIVRIDAHRLQGASRRLTFLGASARHVRADKRGLLIGVARIEHFLRLANVGIDRIREVCLGLLAEKARRLGLFFVEVFKGGVFVAATSATAAHVKPL